MDKKLINDLLQGIDLNDFVTNYCDNDNVKAGKILKELENNGFNIYRKVNSDGEIGFILNNDKKQDEFEIIPCGDTIKTIVITDIHIGAPGEGTMYLERIYKYAKENNIHIILNIGDLFNGINDKTENLLDEYDRQIERFKKNYPYDSNIINFMLFGNHDYYALYSLGIDISKCINDRTDIVNTGYGLSKIKIGEELILLEHDLLFKEQPERIDGARFIFRGHSHKCEIIGNQITFPALQNLDFYPNLKSVGFCEVNFNMKENKIASCQIKQFDFKDDIRLINNFYIPRCPAKIKKKI